MNSEEGLLQSLPAFRPYSDNWEQPHVQRSLSLSHPSRAIIGYDVVRIVLGIVLLTAAGFKVHGLVADSFPHNAWLASRSLEIATISIEIALALWLMSSWASRVTWATALGFFAILAGVSLYTAIHGLPCCCMGSLRLPAWSMFIIDVVAGATLCYCRPRGSQLQTCYARWSRARLGLMPAGAALVLMIGAFSGMTLNGSPAALAAMSGNGFPIQVDDVHFGEVARGQSKRTELSLSNRTDRNIAIGSIQTSCRCLRIELPRRSLNPREVMNGNVELDMGIEPEFVGALETHVTAYAVSGEIAFSLKAIVTVTK